MFSAPKRFGALFDSNTFCAIRDVKIGEITKVDLKIVNLFQFFGLASRK
jgi:hypothetical protein